MISERKTDVLVIGSGAAGLMTAVSFAMQAPSKEVLVLTKTDPSESNTRYAQGGIAVVSDLLADSFEDHIKDTLKAGDFVNDPDIVEAVIKEAPVVMNKVYSWGLKYDEDLPGIPDLGREGGHSANRVVHYRDHTGFELIRVLINRAKNLPNIKLLKNAFALDILTEGEGKDKRAKGVRALNENDEIISIAALKTVLAAGGAGMVYQTTTNPDIATGDSIAMAYLAGVELMGMEYVQFHPTALYSKESSKKNAFLISEALRGFGAILRNAEGKAFMKDYHPLADLAPRDVVSRAIVQQIQQSEKNCVYLDCRHLNVDELKVKFPVIYDVCRSKGLYLERDLIPVRPAAHYMCGGIKVDEKGRSSLPDLFACGECSYTGLHGANRLASNSLLEALVFGKWIAEHLLRDAGRWVSGDTFVPGPFKRSSKAPCREWIQTNREKLRKLMDENAGIIRRDEDLRTLRDELKVMYRLLMNQVNGYIADTGFYELRNLLLTSGMIIDHSLLQKENKGAYFNEDNVLKEQDTLL